MKVKHKCFLQATLGLVAFAMFFWFGSMSVYAYHEDERDIDELQSIIGSLMNQSHVRNVVASGFDLEQGVVNLDLQLNLLDEARDIIAEASVMQNDARGITNNVPILSTWAGPQFEGDDRFSVGFSHERYLPLVQEILEFTGISEDKLDVRVVGVMTSLGLGPFSAGSNLVAAKDFEGYYFSKFDVQHNESDFEPLNSNTSFPMGTRIAFVWRNWMGIQVWEFKTLGHPRNAMGTTAFSTHHGRIPQGAAVHLASGGAILHQIGVLEQTHRHPARGLDVGYIRFNHGFSVSSAIPNGGGNIANSLDRHLQ